MSLKPLPGFRKFETHHCVTGSMRHIYEFHDYPISEDLLLGLGAGVGFVYWHQKGSPPFLGGRGNVERPGVEGFELTVGRRTGVTVERFNTASRKRAEEALLDLLEEEPAMIQVDMGFLPYLRLPEGYHFGWHVIAVAGADRATRTYLVADRDPDLHEVSFDDLELARGSTSKPWPPAHRWWTFDFATSRPPAADEVLEAIGETARAMLLPPISNLGVPGVAKAAKLLPTWPDALPTAQLAGACANVFVMIDATGGTGGGLFRYMYARFLGEAAAITGESALRATAERVHELGDAWQEVAETVRSAAGSRHVAARLREAADRLAVIAEGERDAWTELENLASAGTPAA